MKFNLVLIILSFAKMGAAEIKYCKQGGLQVIMSHLSAKNNAVIQKFNFDIRNLLYKYVFHNVKGDAFMHYIIIAWAGTVMPL